MRRGAIIVSVGVCLGIGSGAGCGSSGPTWPDFQPLHVPMVLTAGGPVMTAPRLVSISYSDAPMISVVDDVIATIGSTPWWKALAEYGVGPVTSTSVVHLTTPAPSGSTVTNADLEAWLVQQITADPTDYGNPSGALYVIDVPSSMKLQFQTATGAANLCQQFDGIHAETKMPDGTKVVYAVVTSCPKAVEPITAVLSHEIAEATTDPFIYTAKAWGDIDPEDQIFATSTREIGDVCQDPLTAAAPQYTPDGHTYQLQRIWSNNAAIAGKSPCVPEPPGDVYFNSYPEFDTKITITATPVNLVQWGIPIKEGQSATVPLHLWSDAPTSGPWTLSAEDRGVAMGLPPHLEFTFDPPMGKNGDTVMMTIHVISTNTAQNGEIFWINSTLGGVTQRWVGTVGG